MADHILTRLLQIAELDPYLNESPELRALALSVQLELDDPSDQTLKTLEECDFPAIQRFLEIYDASNLGQERIGPAGRRPDLKAAALFFPSFTAMRAEFYRSYREEESRDTLESAAEAIVMGEADEGVAGLAQRFQAMVRNLIFEQYLIVDEGERASHSDLMLLALGESKVLEMLQLSTEQLDAMEMEDVSARRVANIILEARSNIDDLGAPSRAQFQRAQIRRRAYIVLTSESAEIIDPRPAISSLEGNGMSTGEAQIALMRGLVQLPGDEDELTVPFDVNRSFISRDPSQLRPPKVTSIAAIEAVALEALLRGPLKGDNNN